MDSSLDDLFADECLLFFEEEGVARYWKPSDIQSMLTVGGPRDAEVRGYMLGGVGMFRVLGFRDACGFGCDLGRAAVVFLVARKEKFSIVCACSWR